MENRFHPSYHAYTYLSGSRIDIERSLENILEEDDVDELIDLLSEPPHFFERLSPVAATIGKQEIKGRNWTDLSIKCYRQFGRIFQRAAVFLNQTRIDKDPKALNHPFMSLSVDPCTLVRLIEHDFESGENSYNKLIELFEKGVVAPVITPPFCPVLPLLPTSFDRRMVVRQGLRFFLPIMRAYAKYLKSVGETQLVISFWLPQMSVNDESIRIIHEEFRAFCKRWNFIDPHLVLLLNAAEAQDSSLDQLMKTWCCVQLDEAPLDDVTVVFCDSGFSQWMTNSHPSIKKMIDRTIAKVSGQLSAQKVDYTWAHFENLEGLLWSPRESVNFEQRIVKLCELGYTPLSPDTFVRHKRSGTFGVGDNEPKPVSLRRQDTQGASVNGSRYFGRWRGWEINGDAQPTVIASSPYEKKVRGGTKRMTGLPCWKIAWTRTRDRCFEAICGKMQGTPGGLLAVLAGLSGEKDPQRAAQAVGSFLEEYALVYWREHFTQHDLCEADIRIDEIIERTLTCGSRRKLSMSEISAAALSAQAYYFLLDSCHSCGLEVENLDQRGIYQNTMMLTLAFANAIAVHICLDQQKHADDLAQLLEDELIGFGSAYDRYDLENCSVERSMWNAATVSEIDESKSNVVERAARRTAARYISGLGYENRFPKSDREISTNVGHRWSTEVTSDNYRWSNPFFCGVKEA